MTTTPRIERSIAVLLSGAALVLSGYRISEFLTDRPRSLPRTGVERDWRKYALDGRIVRDSGARDTVVVFSDYQCPFCRRFEKVLDSIGQKGYAVHLEHRYLPSKAHPLALRAIRIAECSAEQGEFRKMHRLLFDHVEALDTLPLAWLSIRAGLSDSTAFAECVDGSQAIPQLGRDTTAARALFVQGTPTLLIGRIRYNGMPSMDSLVTMLQAARTRTLDD